MCLYVKGPFLREESIGEIPTKDCCVHHCCQFFPRDKLKAIREEMWLRNFRLRMIKKLDVHRTIHANGAGRKVITLEALTFVVRHGTPSTGCQKRNFIDNPLKQTKAAGPVTTGYLNLKKPREATRQATATLATIIVPLADVMPHKTSGLYVKSVF